MTGGRSTEWARSAAARRTFIGFLGILTTTGIFAACVDGADPPSGMTLEDAGGTGDAASTDASSDASIDDAGREPDATAEDDAATDDAVEDASDGGFDVGELPGVRLWLESTRNLTKEPSSNAFAAWTDSSKGQDTGASLHVAVPNGVNPPSIVANAFGGRPTVSFVDGNGNLRIDNHADFEFGLGDFLIVEVAKISSGSGTLWNLRPQATAGWEELVSNGQLCVVFGQGATNGCTGPAATASTDPHVFVARRKGDLFTYRVDGTVKAKLDRAGDPPDIVVTPLQQPSIYLGGQTTMQLSEVLVVVGPTQDVVLEALEKHLKSKYLIP